MKKLVSVADIVTPNLTEACILTGEIYKKYETSDEKVMALIEVKVTPQRGMGFDKIAERIYQYSEVEAVYLMSGAYDFTVFIEGKTMKQVALFVSNKLSPMDSVLSTATHFVLKKYKDHGTILADTVQDERMLITP